MKKIITFLILGSITLLKIYCQTSIDQSMSNWRAVLITPGGELPFQMDLFFSMGIISSGEIKNGDEVINLQIYNRSGSPAGIDEIDSVNIHLPVFNTEIIAKFSDDRDQLIGFWYDRSRVGNYYLPFIAEKNKNYRFLEKTNTPKTDISGRYDAIFSDESSTDKTVGILKQGGNQLTGTFLTTTGDYRFLEGEVSADSFYLSAFDGSHAFLFKGKILEDGTLTGGWWSGKHYSATFTATRNENANLPDARTLTYLKEGYSKIDFSFPDEDGKIISVTDDQFKNKPLVIVITGTWCPNCMDETSFLSEVEEKYKNKIGIIALSFERQPDSLNFKKNIIRERQHFGINYTILNAGLPKTASDALPMLNKIMGFPTTIILNKNHEVSEIYTGFSGPATGDVFIQYQDQFYILIDKLLE